MFQKYSVRSFFLPRFFPFSVFVVRTGGVSKLLIIYSYYCWLKVILLSGVRSHMSTLSCKKVPKAYTDFSFSSLPC